MKAWPALAICVIQVILFLAHWLVFSTWIAFWPGLAPAAVAELHVAMLVLAFSFVAASLLSFRFSNFAVRLVYWLAAVWLGFLNFFFWASLLAWMVWLALRLTLSPAHAASARPLLAGILCAIAALMGFYGLLNARVIRMRRIAVELPDLPASWRGRRAVLLSDLHLGPINGVRFCRRLVAKAQSFQPDLVFLPGDLFDGVHADPVRLIAPFKTLSPPFGIYFSSGNHEEYGGEANFTHVLSCAGIRALSNEKVIVDGLEILGVPYADSHYPIRLRATLDALRPDPAQASILLKHTPSRLPIVEEAGVSLQLSGHTHGGQLIPFTWFVRYVFGKFTYGLHRFGALQVYTSSGVGTWGPPMRVGTQPEVVLFQFL